MHVKDSSGRIEEVSCDSNTTIYELRNIACSKFICPLDSYLSYKGRILKDNEIVSNVVGCSQNYIKIHL